MRGCDATDAFSCCGGSCAGRPPAERCELCGRPSPPEHAHLIEPAARQLLCACDRAPSCSPAADADLQARSTRHHAICATSADRRAVGRADDSDRSGVLFLQQPGQPEWSPCIRAPPVRPNRSSISRHGTRSSRDNPVFARSSPTSRRSSSTGTSDRAPRGTSGAHRPDYYVVPIDECLQAGRPDPQSWSGLSGGTAVWERDRGFFADLKARAVVRARTAVPDLSFAIRERGGGAVRGRAELAFKLRSSMRTLPSQIHSDDRCCAARSRSRRRDDATTPDEQARSVRSVRRTGSLEHDAASRCCGRTRGRRCRGSRADDRHRPQRAVHVRLQRGGDEVFRRARRRRRTADLPVQRHGVLRIGRRAHAGRRANLVGQGSAVSAASADLARADGSLLPEQRLAARCAATPSSGSRTTSDATAFPLGKRRIERMLPANEPVGRS